MPVGTSMVGRKVRSWRGETGTVVRWEPLTHAMCDVLIENEEGGQCWYSISDLKPDDGLGELPSRAEVREQARIEAIGSLKSIREQHIDDFDKPWPGCEFAKAILGRALNAAIKNLEEDCPKGTEEEDGLRQ